MVFPLLNRKKIETSWNGVVFSAMIDYDLSEE